MPSVLITGASGFTGSYLVEEGLNRGFEVYAAIRPSSDLRWLTHPSIRFVRMDPSDESAILESLRLARDSGIRFDHVIHNAGVVKARRHGEYMEVNRDLTIRFIRALSETGLTPSKFVFMSSLAAWGPGDPVTMEPIRQTDPSKPAGLYGRSKREAEQYIIGESGLPYLIFRPTGVYGPRDRDYAALYRAIRLGLEFYVGTGNQGLSFIYASDLARAVYDAMSSSLVNREYFISDGFYYTAEEFSGIVKSILRRRTVRVTVPPGLFRFVSALSEDLFSLWNGRPFLNRDRAVILGSRNWKCDPSPLFRDLGFTPRYDLRKGLQETLLK